MILIWVVQEGTLSVPGLPEHLSLWRWPDELESWSWPGFEGQPVQLRVFARGCERARLLLNGQNKAESAFMDNLTAVMVIPYAPGNLTAVCVNGSRELTQPVASLITEGALARVVLTVDRVSIKQSPNDLVYATASVVDADGIMIYQARPVINFTVSGPAELTAIGSGDPSDSGSLRTNSRQVWRGRVVAIVRPVGSIVGKITITATAEGLASVTTRIDTI